MASSMSRSPIQLFQRLNHSRRKCTSPERVGNRHRHATRRPYRDGLPVDKPLPVRSLHGSALIAASQPNVQHETHHHAGEALIAGGGNYSIPKSSTKRASNVISSSSTPSTSIRQSPNACQTSCSVHECVAAGPVRVLSMGSHSTRSG